jgi:hypothetical protein
MTNNHNRLGMKTYYSQFGKTSGMQYVWKVQDLSNYGQKLILSKNIWTTLMPVTNEHYLSTFSHLVCRTELHNKPSPEIK